jgi:hypothetical protein
VSPIRLNDIVFVITLALAGYAIGFVVPDAPGIERVFIVPIGGLAQPIALFVLVSAIVAQAPCRALIVLAWCLVWMALVVLAMGPIISLWTLGAAVVAPWSVQMIFHVCFSLMRALWRKLMIRCWFLGAADGNFVWLFGYCVGLRHFLLLIIIPSGRKCDCLDRVSLVPVVPIQAFLLEEEVPTELKVLLTLTGTLTSFWSTPL